MFHMSVRNQRRRNSWQWSRDIFGRIRSAIRWMRCHPWMACLFLLVIGLIGLNVVAYQHAKAMIWFVDGGPRTSRPDKLSTWGKIQVLLTGVKIPRPENDRTPDSIELEYTAERIQVVDDVTLEAWLISVDEPKGTVLLFHGYAGAKCDLLPEAKAFSDLGFTVWLIDFRGSGGSSERYTTVGFAEAEDVAAIVAHVEKVPHEKPLILYGRSMGAAAILRAIDVFGVSPDGVILESVFDRMLTTAGNRFQLMGLPSYPGANLLVFWGGVCAGFDASHHNPVDYAAKCSCPTLLLHGDEDLNARLDEGKAVQSQLQDREAELAIFPKTGHEPTRAVDSDLWHHAVLRLLKRAADSR